MDDLQHIDTAPKDGTVVHVKAVWGLEPDDGKISYEGNASWRGEDKEALHDPITGDEFAAARTIVGWMRADSPYRVPGRIVGWRHTKER